MVNVDFVAVNNSIGVGVFVAVIDVIPIGICLQRIGAIFHFVAITETVFIGIRHLWVSCVNVDFIAVIYPIRV